MSEPLLSIIIPTIGRDTLARTLDSIDRQPGGVDAEVLVVGDTLDGPVPVAEAEVAGRDERYRYLAHAGERHMYGQPQRQAGMADARGRWLVFGADDNIWTGGAFDEIVSVIGRIPRSMPLLFRVRPRGAAVVWRDTQLRVGNVDADCIVAPNDPGRLGTWGMRYEGDFDFATGTIDAHGGAVRWCEALISLARPRPDEDWTRA